MEQALVFASIIIGVAISDQVLSLHRLLRSGVEVRWHWAQPWFAIIVLLTAMMIWWSIAAEETGSVSIGAFLPNVVTLIMVALLTVNSLPDQIGPDPVGLADYYQRNRRYQWTLLTLIFAWNLVVDAVAIYRSGAPVVASLLDRWIDLTGLALTFAMGFVRRWIGVAIGLAITSVPAGLWLARTIG